MSCDEYYSFWKEQDAIYIPPTADQIYDRTKPEVCLCLDAQRAANWNNAFTPGDMALAIRAINGRV